MNNRRKKIKLIANMFFLLLLLSACNPMGNQALENRHIDEGYLRGLQTGGDHEPLNQPQGQLSSESTSIPSEQFPHTKAVQVQQAKYEFVVVPQGGQQPSPEEIARLLPEGIQLSQEEISRFIAEGTQLSPEVIAARIRERMEQEKPAAPTPQQPQQPQEQAAQPQQPQKQREQKEQAKQEATDQPSTGASNIAGIESKVIELTNVERRNNGLSELKADASLSKVAQEKSNDMQKNNYFSHTSPTYGSPFDMMRDFGVTYQAAARI